MKEDQRRFTWHERERVRGRNSWNAIVYLSLVRWPRIKMENFSLATTKKIKFPIRNMSMGTYEVQWRVDGQTVSNGTIKWQCVSDDARKSLWISMVNRQPNSGWYSIYAKQMERVPETKVQALHVDTDDREQEKMHQINGWTSHSVTLVHSPVELIFAEFDSVTCRHRMRQINCALERLYFKLFLYDLFVVVRKAKRWSKRQRLEAVNGWRLYFCQFYSNLKKLMHHNINASSLTLTQLT